MTCYIIAELLPRHGVCENCALKGLGCPYLRPIFLPAMGLALPAHTQRAAGAMRRGALCCTHGKL